MAATTGLLDNFNRADVSPVSPNWTNNFVGQGLSGMKIVSQQLVPITPLTTAGAAAWTQGPYSPDQEVWITNTTKVGRNRLYARLTTLDSTCNGYNVDWDGANLFFNKVTNGTSVQIGPTNSVVVASGDVIRLRCVGGSLEAYINDVLRASLIDNSYYSTGYLSMLAFNSSDVFDNFGGGSITRASDTPVPIAGLGATW